MKQIFAKMVQQKLARYHCFKNQVGGKIFMNLKIDQKQEKNGSFVRKRVNDDESTYTVWRCVEGGYKPFIWERTVLQLLN